MNRRHFLPTTLLAASAAGIRVGRLGAAEAAEFKFEPSQNIIPAPNDPALWPGFRRQLAEWRAEKRRELNYSDALYRRKEFSWTTANFCCCFLMLCDESFYDPRTGRYTARDFLKREAREFGGYDSVVLWHAYPRIGVDERNQFDFYRDMPGGLKGLRDVVHQLQHEGVRVFLDYNPWDTGTRREGKPDLEALCEMVGALDADGIFLDTMDRGAAEFRGMLDAARPGVVLEGEAALPLERVHDHHCSWAQWFNDSAAPGVLRNKWFERRHLQHQIKRWDDDHTGELHAAWMNGSGMMVWENVFGSWVGWCERDKAILRQMLPIQRRFALLFSDEGWTPLVPTLTKNVYASLWEGDGVRLWTLVNRSEQNIEAAGIEISARLGEKLFDLIGGDELAPKLPPRLRIPARGIGCVLAAPLDRLGRNFARFLKGQRQIMAQAKWDVRAHAINTELKPVAPTRLQAGVPEGMVVLPAATLDLKIQMRVRECGFYKSMPPAQHRLGASYDFQVQTFEKRVTLRRFAMDLTPVTNAQFAAFLRSSGYRPRHPENFLKHWPRRAMPPEVKDHPVIHVDLDDARAYARWAGKRLPTEEEWQYAAQGPDGRKYPWGKKMLPNRCNDGSTGRSTSVKAFPDGRSPFGIYDLCGNTWEWTESERTDGRTRFCIIRGGSFYQAKGSNWYMDGGVRPVDFAAKFLLMWPGLDRCSTIGCRCALDLA